MHLGTMHGMKGLEFQAVAVIGGGEERCFVSGRLFAGGFAAGHPRMLA